MIVRVGNVQIQLRIHSDGERIAQLVRVAASQCRDASDRTAVHSIDQKELDPMIARIGDVDVSPTIHGHADGMIEKSRRRSADTCRTADDQRPTIFTWEEDRSGQCDAKNWKIVLPSFHRTMLCTP